MKWTEFEKKFTDRFVLEQGDTVLIGTDLYKVGSAYDTRGGATGSVKCITNMDVTDVEAQDLLDLERDTCILYCTDTGKTIRIEKI